MIGTRRAAWLLAVLCVVPACKRTAADTGPSGPPPVAVETEPVAEVEVPSSLRLTGSLRGWRETDLAANASGRVVATSVERGAAVAPGQVLAQLDVRAASLSASETSAMAESARAQEAQAKIDCDRNEKLHANGAISKAEYDRIAIQCKTTPLTSEAATARARLAAQNVGDGVIRAPFAGVVTERYVEVGQYLKQDSRVVTLVSLDPLRLELAVPEAHIGKIKEDAEVSFKVAAYPERTFTGKLRFVSGAVRASTRDLVVEAMVENPDKVLKPGMFADVELAVGTRKLPGVPKKSVAMRDGKPHAYFVIGGRLEERVLATASEAGASIAVTKGAAIGEKVAVGDVSKLTNGQRVR